MKICSVGTWLSSSNVGDNAVFTGVQDLMPGAQFTVFSAAPERVREAFGVQAFAPRKNLPAIIKAIANADGLLFTGGTPFFDDPAHMAYYAGLAALAKLLGKRIIIFGVSIRTLNKPALYWVRFILNRADYIGAREMRTYQAFLDLSRHKDRIALFFDPAINMKPEPAASADRFLRGQGIDPDKPVLGICLRNFRSGEAFQKHHYSKRFTESILQNYIGSVRAFVEFAIEQTGYQVVFLPMHIHPPDDDRAAAQEVCDGIAGSSANNRIVSIEQQLSPRRMKAVLGRMRLVIGVRFHSLVLSAAMGTPVINIGYARKNEEIMKLAGLGRFSIPLEQVSCEQLQLHFAEIERHRHEIVHQLEHRHERWQRETAQECKKILRVLSGVPDILMS